MGDGQSVRYGESTQLLKRPLDPQKDRETTADSITADSRIELGGLV